MSAVARALKPEPPTLAEVAPVIQRRMHEKSGSVTLHFMRGRLETIEWGDREDSRCLVKQD